MPQRSKQPAAVAGKARARPDLNLPDAQRMTSAAKHALQMSGLRDIHYRSIGEGYGTVANMSAKCAAPGRVHYGSHLAAGRRSMTTSGQQPGGPRALPHEVGEP
jgi:hypothetical protein